MTLKLRCPACNKGERSEVIEVLPERKYVMKCEDCGRIYVVAAGGDEEKETSNDFDSERCRCR